MSSRVALGAALALCLWAPRALADSCDPASGISTCFDPDNVWLSAGPGRFFAIAPAEAMPDSTLGFAVAMTWVDRPVLLNAPSPDPEGRDIPVVRDAQNLDLAWAYGLGSSLELSLATPITLHQSGSGAEGVTSQSAPPLTRTAVRDARLGVAVGLPVRSAGLSAKARFDLGVPVGDSDAYASAGGPVAAPSLSLASKKGRFFAGAEVGVRLRRSVPFASARIGSSLLTSVGFGADLLDDRWLCLGVESYLLQSLVSQPETGSAKDRLLAPAEWIAWLGSSLGAGPGFQLSAGGGTGIPLSSEVKDGQTDHFAGVTAPRFRLFLAARYTPTP
jgi:hypothetical protein